MIAALITVQHYDSIPPRQATDIAEQSPGDLSVPSDETVREQRPTRHLDQQVVDADAP